MGEGTRDALRVVLDGILMLEFHGSRVTSEVGMLAYRDLDDALDLTATAGAFVLLDRIQRLRPAKATPDLGSEAGSSGDSLRSVGKSVIATVKQTRTHGEHKPRSTVWQSESASNRRGCSVESAKTAHGGRAQRIQFELPANSGGW